MKLSKKEKERLKKERKEREKRRLIFWLWVAGIPTILFVISAVVGSGIHLVASTSGEGPFHVFLIRNVVTPAIMGGFFLLAGLFVIGFSIYKWVTKTAFNAKGMILHVSVLSVGFLGFAYLFLGLDWTTYVSDAKTYYDRGASKTVIVLEGYEVKRYSGKDSGPPDYIFTSADGETYDTVTEFELNIEKGAKYRIYYLPKTNYLVGIEMVQ